MELETEPKVGASAPKTLKQTEVNMQPTIKMFRTKSVSSQKHRGKQW